MEKTKITEEQMEDWRCQLDALQTQHSALLAKACQGSKTIAQLYKAIWEPEALLLSEQKLIRESIRTTDFLLYCPK